MNSQVAELDLGTRRRRFRPTSELISLVVFQTSYVRPAVIGAAFQDVDLVVGFWPLFRLVEGSVRTEVDSLRVAVTVSKNVTDNTINLRVIPGDGAVEIHPQRFACVG